MNVVQNYLCNRQKHLEQTLVLKQLIGSLASLPLLLAVKEMCTNSAAEKVKINLYT